MGGRDVCVGGAGSSSGGKGGEEAAGWDRKPVARGEGVREGKGPAMDGVGMMEQQWWGVGCDYGGSRGPAVLNGGGFRP